MPNRHPLVTIILPVYNGEKSLQATLDSLLVQTFDNFELLIGIDGTKDDSKFIAESIEDNRITVFENPVNLGLGPNLNKLISLASPHSEFIAMAEQDDIYVPKRLEWQVEVMNLHPKVGLVSGIAEFISPKKKVLFPGLLLRGEQFSQGKKLFKFLYIHQLKVVNTCMMFRKSTHSDYNLIFRNTYGNFNIDWDYVLRFSLISEIYGIQKKLVSMNRHVINNSVTTNKAQQHKASRQLLKDFKNEFSVLIKPKDYRKALKMHRKIELGHHSKLGILFYSTYYFLLYFDPYFLKYIILRIRKYFKTKRET